MDFLHQELQRLRRLRRNLSGMAESGSFGMASCTKADRQGNLALSNVRYWPKAVLQLSSAGSNMSRRFLMEPPVAMRPQPPFMFDKGRYQS